MRILITGGTGLLGKALVETNKKHKIIATYLGSYNIESSGQVKYARLDIKDKNGYCGLFKEFRPEVVVHAAGISSPDYAEKNKEEAREVNVCGTQQIIANCEQFGSRFIYISSNGIYDGNKAPYSENSKAAPINYYGQIKLEGEDNTKKANICSAVVRPILMYGWNHPFERSNIITEAISKLQKGKEIFAYDDVYLNPLFSQSCAKAIWEIIEKDRYEDFNIAGRDRMNIYELVQKAAETFGLDISLIIPVQQGFFNELVKRPRDTSYNTEKMERVLGLKPLSVAEGLLLMKAAGSLDG